MKLYAHMGRAGPCIAKSPVPQPNRIRCVSHGLGLREHWPLTICRTISLLHFRQNAGMFSPLVVGRIFGTMRPRQTGHTGYPSFTATSLPHSGLFCNASIGFLHAPPICYTWFQVQNFKPCAIFARRPSPCHRVKSSSGSRDISQLFTYLAKCTKSKP